MKFNGFDSYFYDGQFIVDIVMPEELYDVFFARFYGRGNLMDKADGDPVKIWTSLSSQFNGIKLIAPQQVHGTEILKAEGQNSLPLRPEADGVFIDKKSDCHASLRFADCTPVVIAGIYPEPWMLILHSGFVGTMKNIVSNSMERLMRNFNAASSGGAWAWIGPGICRDCYSRSKDDPKTIAAQNIFSPTNQCSKGGYMYFDIRGQIKEQLLQLGFYCDNIYTFEACTYCASDIFYSYRSGDEMKRIFLLAGNATKQG